MQGKMPMFYSALMLTGVDLMLRMVSTGFQVYLSGQIGAAGIGLLQLVLSVGSMAMTAGIAGVRTATMYLTAEELGKKHPESVTWILSGTFLYSFLCSFSVAGLLYAFAPQIATNWLGEPDAADAIRLLAAFLPTSCLTGVMAGYFTAANRIGTLAAVEIAEQLCSMCVTVCFLRLWAGNDPAKACQGVVLGSGFGAILTLCCLVYLRLREKAIRGKRIPVARRLTGTAVPLALADDLKAGISTTENLMVPQRLSLYAGADDPMALFGTVCGMVFPVLMFPAAILFGLTQLLIPELARCNAAGSRHRISYLMHRSLRIALFYGTLCSGILFLIAPELCVKLYKNDDAGAYLRMFSVLAVMLYCDIVTDAMIKGLGQQKASVRYNILTSAMDVALLFLLLPKYGMTGYYCSFLITHLINFILSLRRLLKITKEKISFYIPTATILCAILSVALSISLTSPTLRAVSFLLLFFTTGTLTGTLTRKDLIWLKKLIRPPRPMSLS